MSWVNSQQQLLERHSEESFWACCCKETHATKIHEKSNHLTCGRTLLGDSQLIHSKQLLLAKSENRSGIKLQNLPQSPSKHRWSTSRHVLTQRRAF